MNRRTFFGECQFAIIKWSALLGLLGFQFHRYTFGPAAGYLGWVTWCGRLVGFVPKVVLIAALCISPASASCYRQRVVYVQKAVAVVPVALVQPVYYQVGSSLREEAIAQLAAQKAIEALKVQHAQELQAQRQQFTQQLNGAISARGTVCVDFNGGAGASTNTSGPPAHNGVTPTPAPPPSPMPQPPPSPEPEPDQPPSEDLTAKAQAIFSQRCVMCHGPAKQAKNLRLDSIASVPQNKLHKSVIRAFRGTMPPAPHPPIPQDEADLLLQWAEGLK